MAEEREFIDDIFATREHEPPMAFRVHIQNRRADGGGIPGAISEIDSRLSARAFAGTQHDPPIVACVFFEQQHFELAAAAVIFSLEPRRDYFAVIPCEQVARAQKLQQLLEPMMCHRAVTALQHKQPRFVPVLSGALSDEFRWQWVVEVARAHAEDLSCAGEQITPKSYAVLCSAEQFGLWITRKMLCREEKFGL